jgi:bromodomain-containing factor 1
VSECWRAKGAFFFQEPVDPIKFNIPDYLAKIDNPMDFTTIKKKLSHNCYKNPEAFINDMYLVFSNCLLYNGPDNPVSQHAIKIGQLFESNCKIYGLPRS